METDIVAPATPTEPTTPVETPAEPSIADHEAAYGKGARGAEPDVSIDINPPIIEKPRHRAKSQQASAADVPRIAELTKKLRDAERERDEWKTRVSTTPTQVAAPAPQVSAVPAQVAATSPQVATTDEPTWQAFEDKIGTDYKTWGEAQNAWMKSWRAWDKAEATRTVQDQQQAQAYQKVYDDYRARAIEYGKTSAEFHAKMEANTEMLKGMPMPLLEAIVRLDNGPFIAEYLVDHPVELDSLWLATEGREATPSFVALLQRRLSHYRAPAAATGSVATTPPRIASRPPNPVRTGPLNTGDELPGDNASIAEHEKVFGRKRRR